MAGSLLPQPKQVAFDSAMNPGIAYQFYTYDVGTLTPKATYQDAALTIANTNPVIANGRGEVVMYGNGQYRLILKDALGSLIWDRDNVGSIDLSAITSSLVSFLQAGTGAVSRTVESRLRDTVSVKDFGATGNGVTNDTAAIQLAATAVGYGGVLYFPKGTYFVSSTITLRGATKMLGDGIEETIIKRTGDYGDTFVCGSAADQSEPARSFGASKIRFQHSDPYVANSTTLANKVTQGAHIRLRGAQEALIQDCWFMRMRYGVYCEGGSWVKVLNSQFLGVYDPANAALQEGVAGLVAAHSAIHGNPTTWLVTGNNFLGATFERVVNYVHSTGTAPVNRVATIGQQYGFLIDGGEDFVINDNYFGGQNVAELAFIQSAGGSIIDVRIAKNFFDGISEGSAILVAPSIANKLALAMSIEGNIFTDTLRAIFINQNAADGKPSVVNLTITSNTLLSGIGSQMLLNGAKGFVVSGNTISDYNKYAFTATDANYTTAINVYGASLMGQVTGNTIGGGSNLLLNDITFNQCYVGVSCSVDSVYIGGNYYSGIRDGANFRTGLAEDENQVSATTGAYQIKSSDSVVLMNKATGGTSATALPVYPIFGREVIVKDNKGDAGTNAVTVTTNDGSTIDGAASSVISTNYGSKRFRYNGNAWNVIN